MQYFRIASIMLIVIGTSHLIGHFLLIPHLQLTYNFTGELPKNQTEEKLLELMNNYSRNIGGSNLSMMDLQNGLSLCYALFFLWMGALNILIVKGLVRNQRLLSHICFLNVGFLIFGAAISWRYFFWLPIASFISSAIMFIVAAFKMRRSF